LSEPSASNQLFTTSSSPSPGSKAQIALRAASAEKLGDLDEAEMHCTGHRHAIAIDSIDGGAAVEQGSRPRVIHGSRLIEVGTRWNAHLWETAGHFLKGKLLVSSLHCGDERPRRAVWKLSTDDGPE
jgi:hypothetical protein